MIKSKYSINNRLASPSGNICKLPDSGNGGYVAANAEMGLLYDT